MTRTLLLGVALLAAPSALAQQHGGMDHSQMDHSQMPGMSHAEAPATDHDALVALHERMMADPEIHARMMADPEMRALMQETMTMGHAGMAGGAHHAAPTSADAQAAMADQMRERMAAMPPAEHAAFMARLETAQMRLMADPEVHGRMMADPEMHRMMMALPGGMPGMDGMEMGSMQGMDHSQMGHSAMPGMDMPGMDHGGMAMGGAEEGVGHEREVFPDVDPAAFDASATADRFHAALVSGDREAMEAILAPDAVVLEGGRHEARAEYLSDHFDHDVAALAGATPESLFRRTGTAGDAAWVASTQRSGTVDTAELLVMKQTPQGWRVAAVHWSSGARD